MKKTMVSVMAVATLFGASALAQTADVTDPALRPGAGLVHLHINATEARRVMLPTTTATGTTLRYVCTTPCTLYVAPGDVAVTLQGWGNHEYHWTVPAQGGSVHLLARSSEDQRLRTWARARDVAVRHDAVVTLASR